MSEKLCKAINAIDKSIIADLGNGIKLVINNNLTPDDYCGSNESEEKGECISYSKLVNYAFITLIKYFKYIVDDDDVENVLEYDNLADYAILWLSYKLNLMSYVNVSNLNDFNNKYIKNNKEIIGDEAYSSYKNSIEKKQDLMNMNIEDMLNFYAPLKSLCNMYTECNENKTDCRKCSQKAKEFVEEYQKIKNNSSIARNSLCSQILSTLSSDYDILKNKCKDCSSFPTIEEIQHTSQGSEGTSSSLPIASKLIPVLSVFGIPIFLGIAYKVNNKEFKNIILKNCFCDSLCVIIKKYIIRLPFLY
ncbi:Plasmodium variant antigen protein Cir/Yir/Bir, putative [Plasmodium chabaudi chabaudi]|uniref:Plasmodium variant antigen protein Cir/Yir/Bir, putative n=1 Tax=Plasmodium chabaudi chabaudi TaxID=31271 RepID=A0A1D3L7F3_PLACU|nr:Plasmodium variant antigen protein Cir/Yir/Bir, putative [Plasmodium chabaudi chabaudi]